MSNTTVVKSNAQKTAKDFLNSLIYKVDIIRKQVEGDMVKGGHIA